VDAQLPQLLAVWLKEYGYDTIHTLELPEANRSND
jgi:predicted nuclease of predicted toxin-antitoxin system